MPKLIVTDIDRTLLVDLRSEEGAVLGRAPDCDVPVGARRASRRHFEIQPHEGGHVVRDLGSTNGTFLNGAPLTAEQVLSDGDEISLGTCTVLYRSEP